MFRGAKCLLEGHTLTRTPTGGIALEMDVSVWESSILPEGHTLRMRFILSPEEASELSSDLVAAVEQDDGKELVGRTPQ